MKYVPPPMNTVTIICKDKRPKVRKFSSLAAAMDSLRWWVVLDHAEREFAKFVFGK